MGIVYALSFFVTILKEWEYKCQKKKKKKPSAQDFIFPTLLYNRIDLRYSSV